MDQNKLNKTIDRARALMSDPNFNYIVEKKSKDIGNFGNPDGTIDYDAYTSNSGYDDYTPPAPLMNNRPISEDAFEHSKLPAEILRSMKENPLDFDGATTGGISVLDQIGAKPVKQQQRQTIVERTNASQPQYNTISSSNSGIDYGVIKALIDESIRRNLAEAKENILNENKGSLRSIVIGKGNKIQLVDTKGNVYEATLALKGNINKK